MSENGAFVKLLLDILRCKTSSPGGTTVLTLCAKGPFKLVRPPQGQALQAFGRGLTAQFSAAAQLQTSVHDSAKWRSGLRRAQYHQGAGHHLGGLLEAGSGRPPHAGSSSGQPRHRIPAMTLPWPAKALLEAAR